MQKNNTKNKNSKGAIVSVVAGIAGAAIGAAAVALSDKKTRKKIGVAIEKVADQGKEAVNDLQNQVKDKVKIRVEQLGKKISKTAKEGEFKAE